MYIIRFASILSLNDASRRKTSRLPKWINDSNNTWLLIHIVRAFLSDIAAIRILFSYFICYSILLLSYSNL